MHLNPGSDRPGFFCSRQPKVPAGLVRTTGLLRRTGRRTVPDMFTRHRTEPDRATEQLAQSFHDRLAGTLLMRRTDPPRIDGRDLRSRLGGAPAAGLRDRLGRLSPT